jgi:ubiquinol-cytochrome c reductase cytochrome b subunit
MKKKLYNWLDARFPITNIIKNYFSNYYVPKNLNFFYYFGAIALIVLINQFVSGIWLSMFYTPTVSNAFDSIEYIMRDVNFGWLLRHLHTTGASAFFVVLYLHIFRGILYGSYQKPRELVWLLGVFLFIIILAEAFFGYLLPWGQMSYWSCQVITSLFSVIPYFGDNIVTWIRGDFIVSNVTLQRFYSLHIILLPLLMLLLVFLHIVAIHHVGSNNPDGVTIKNNPKKNSETIPFYPLHMLKEFIAILVFLMIFLFIVFFFPNLGGFFIEPANHIIANSMQSPDNIKPLWYMLPFYTILQVIPNKTIGVVALFSSIFILLFLPWLDKSPVRSMRYKGIYSKVAFWIFCICFVSLGFLGIQEQSCTQQITARIATGGYFLYFLLMPYYTKYETPKDLPTRQPI